jgi:hypothetical protein
MVGRCKMGPYGSEVEPEAGSCEDGKEPLGSLKCKKMD